MLLLAHLWGGDPHGLFAVNGDAGNYRLPIGGRATAYGPVVAEREAYASAGPLPTRLANMPVRITDARGAPRETTRSSRRRALVEFAQLARDERRRRAGVGRKRRALGAAFREPGVDFVDQHRPAFFPRPRRRIGVASRHLADDVRIGRQSRGRRNGPDDVAVERPRLSLSIITVSSSRFASRTRSSTPGPSTTRTAFILSRCRIVTSAVAVQPSRGRCVPWRRASANSRGPIPSSIPPSPGRRVLHYPSFVRHYRNWRSTCATPHSHCSLSA
jgi:hypothetical protein